MTLHIGLGTFRAVDVEDLTKHKMDSENFIVGSDAVKHAIICRKIASTAVSGATPTGTAG